MSATKLSALMVAGVPIYGQLPQAPSGKVFYVAEDGSNGNREGSFERPWGTVDYAIGQCVADRGDIIMVKAGYSETITAAAGWDVDVAGVTIFGLGQGAKLPTVTFTTATAADIDIDAANCAIENVRFLCGIASQTAMIDVNAANARIRGCFFGESGTTGLTCIDINGGAANACDGAEITDNVFLCATAGNWDRAIELGEVADNVLIARNRVIGDFDDAGIHNPTGKVLTNLALEHNVVRNNQSGQHAVELVSACTGHAVDNRFITDAQATAFDAGALACAGNLWNISTGGDSEGVPVNPESDSASNFVGVNDADNGVSTSSVVANQDGSVLERAEQLQQLAAMAGFYNSANYLAVTADFTSATWNTAAAHEIATVTGAVRMLILPQCTGTLTSAGGAATLILGDETTTNSIIASSDAEALAAGEWWADTTITRTILTRTLLNGLEIVVGNGKDIGYTIGTEALTGGSIVFHIWWVPIDATGAVAAGAGGAL